MVGAVSEIFIFTRRKFPGSGIAVVLFMMVVSGPTYSLAGGLCIGTTVALDKGEAAMRCALPVNVKGTRHSILIKHCTNFSDPKAVKDTVFECHWPTEEADKPDCMSGFSFSLVAPLTDQVLARVPVSRLMDTGTYKVQLSPRDDNKPYTSCHIHHFSGADEATRPAVTHAPAAFLSRTESQGVETQEPQKRAIPHCEERGVGKGLTVAVLVLQIVTIIVLGVHICLRCPNKQRREKEHRDKRWKIPRLFTGSEKRDWVPTTEPPAGKGHVDGI